MFTQPAPSPPTLATTTSPASPTRPSRLRGLSYLRNYTHNHLHSRDSAGSSPTNSRPFTLARATSYPSPASTPTGTRPGASPSTPTAQSPLSFLSPSIQGTVSEVAGNSPTAQESTISGWLPSIGGRGGLSRIGSQTQSTTSGSSSVALSGNGDSGEVASSTQAMGRTRSATTGRAAGTDISQLNGGPDPQLQGLSDVPLSRSYDTSAPPSSHPSIRFSQYFDARAPRPSLVFVATTRTLLTGKEIIRVGRYSEREVQPNISSNAPSAAPVGFKSKVVSRRHCEFWSENGKWYIKDVKSSSGTFLNHVRLSAPGVESKPFEVKDGDVVQLGIDFKGGEEMIFRCVKIRVELNRNWQLALNTFNVTSHKQLRNMARQNLENGSSSQDCSICLGAIAPCQSLFVAPCSHTWHYKCVRRLLNGPMFPQFICPNCRAVADLDADNDEPLGDAEWEAIDRAEAAESANGPATEASIEPLVPAQQAVNPTEPLVAEVVVDEIVSPSGIAVTGAEPETSSIESDPEIEAAAADMRDLDLAESPLLGRQDVSYQESHSTIQPIDIRPGRSSTSRRGAADIDDLDGAGSFHRIQRTPSPSERNNTNDDVSALTDGPMTPRNDAGPFVFDGSAAGSGSGVRMAALNLATVNGTPVPHPL